MLHKNEETCPRDVNRVVETTGKFLYGMRNCNRTKDDSKFYNWEGSREKMKFQGF